MPRRYWFALASVLALAALALIGNYLYGPRVLDKYNDHVYSYKTVKTSWGPGNPPSYRLGKADREGLLYALLDVGPDQGVADMATMSVVNQNGVHMTTGMIAWKGYLSAQDYLGKTVILRVIGPDGYTEVKWSPGGGQ